MQADLGSEAEADGKHRVVEFAVLEFSEVPDRLKNLRHPGLFPDKVLIAVTGLEKVLNGFPGRFFGHEVFAPKPRGLSPNKDFDDISSVFAAYQGMGQLTVVVTVVDQESLLLPPDQRHS